MRNYKLSADFVLLICLCLLQFTTISAQNSNLKSYKEIASDAYYAEKYDTAIVYYNKWLKADPKDYKIYYDLACTYGLNGQKSEALEAFLSAVHFGWEDFEHPLKDMDLKSIWNETAFLNAIEICKTIAAQKEIENSFLHQSEMKSIGSYLVILPPDYEASSKHYPLCVILHGSGSTTYDHGRLSNKFGRDDYIFLVPRAPHPHKGVISYLGELAWTAWYPDDIDEKDENFKKVYYNYLEWIDHCIEEVKDNYRIQGDKILLIGHSQGAHFANAYAMNYPEKVLSYIAFAGNLNKYNPFTKAHFAGLKNNKVKVVLLHGKNDGVIPYTASEKLAKEMEKHEVDCQLTLFDAKHGFTSEINEFVKKWLIENKDKIR